MMFKSLKQIWNKRSKLEKKLKVPPNSGRFIKAILYIGIDYQTFKNQSLVKLSFNFEQVLILFRIIFGIILFMLKLSLKIFVILLTQATKSIFKCIDIVQLILSTQIIVVFIMIIKYPQIELNEDGSQPDVIAGANYLANFQEYYRTLIHINVFITFLRILQFFTFSKKLSSYSEILSKAKFDILFFVLMFGFLLFGFAVAGFAIYGAQVAEYKTITTAAVNLIRTILLDFNYSAMYNADSTLAGLFFVTFLLIFKIALLNMFIAIIVAHFNQFRREEQGDEREISIFTVIAKILKDNLFEMKKEKGNKKECCSLRAIGIYLFGNPQSKKKEGKNQNQKEASKIQTILSERVAKPSLKDYKIHYGMTSYFQDAIQEKSQNMSKDQNASQLLIGNATIYKRAEQQGYQEYDFNSSNFWIFNLEENLMKQTNNKVSLYDFHTDDGIFSNLLENLDPNNLTRFQSEFLMINNKQQPGKRLIFFEEKAVTITQKFDLWKAMDFEKQIKVITSSDQDLGISILKYIFDILQDQEEQPSKRNEDFKNIQFKILAKSMMFSDKFNRVTKMQQYLWTQILSTENQYQLWFEVFNAQDRVRLWNTLVFSENYFNYVAYNHKFNRTDIKVALSSMKVKIQSEILKREDHLNAKATQQSNETDIKLGKKEQLRIRDKYYDSKVMLKLWQLLKQRKYESDQQGKKKSYVTLNRKDYSEMVTSMFKIMVWGISNDILKTVLKMNKHKAPNSSRLDIYTKLKDEVFEDSEYRLSLWLPLTLKEKLDMVMHQRVEEEMEIMLFLIDQEFDISKNLGNSDQLDLLLERSFDIQIFKKYQQVARYEAVKKSLDLCQKRLQEVQEEDVSLLEYVAYMREKADDCQSSISQLRAEVFRNQKKNEKLAATIKEEEAHTNRVRAVSSRREKSIKGSAKQDDPFEKKKSLKGSSINLKFKRSQSQASSQSFKSAETD